MFLCCTLRFLRVKRDRHDRVPVSGFPGPPFRMIISGFLIEHAASGKDFHIKPVMLLIRRHPAQATVPVFRVVPPDKVAYPSAGTFKVAEPFPGPLRAVFQRPEQRFGVRVVVADPGPAVRRRYTQFVQLRLHREALHRRTVISMQHQSAVTAFSDHTVRCSSAEACCPDSFS